MKLQLNFNKPDNYAFFCPVSKVHLTRSNPVAEVNEVTPYIERGLKTKAILEIAEDTTGQKVDTNIKKSELPKSEELETSMPSTEETVVNAPVESEQVTEQAPTPSEKPRRGKQKKA